MRSCAKPSSRLLRCLAAPGLLDRAGLNAEVIEGDTRSRGSQARITLTALSDSRVTRLRNYWRWLGHRLRLSQPGRVFSTGALLVGGAEIVVGRVHGEQEGGAPLVVLALLLVGVVTLDAVGRGSGRCYSPSHLGWWALGPPCGRRNPRPPRTAEARRPAASPGFSRLGLCCPEFYLNELRRREAAGRERWLLWLTAVITVLTIANVVIVAWALFD
jgi:hypothetical protein